MINRRKVLSGLIGGLASTSVPLSQARASARVVVATSGGSVAGARSGEVAVFLGIPYGADTRSTRFRAPRPVEPWTGVLNATTYGHRAPQAKRTPHKLSRSWKDLSSGMSEDCLNLNVWTPGTSGKRPVMVWFHGGGFGAGSGNNTVLDGTNLARRGDVVVVTVSHRLNVFGFLYLGELALQRYPDSGNAGLLDLVQALRWVQDNIDRFGGDPANVTIFGESGGGAKVSYLLGMPQADGLYSRAIIQSGAFLAGAAPSAASEKAEIFLAKLGVRPGEIGSLETIDMTNIVRALGSASTVAERMAYTPVTDGRSLPADPFTPDARPHTGNIPLLVGTTKWEYIYQLGQEDPTLFRLSEEDLPERLAKALQAFGIQRDPGEVIRWYQKHRPDYTPGEIVFGSVSDGRIGRKAAALADRHTRLDQEPTYVYRVDWHTPVDGGRWKAAHAVDVPLVFDNVEKGSSMTGNGGGAQEMAHTMSTAWVAFARSGSPQTPELPNWPAYGCGQRPTMIFNDRCEVKGDPDGDIRQFWADS